MSAYRCLRGQDGQRHALLALLGVNMLAFTRALCVCLPLGWMLLLCVSGRPRCAVVQVVYTLSSRDLRSTALLSLGTGTVRCVCGPGHLHVCVLVANVPRYVILLPVARVFTLRLLRAVQL